VEQDPLTGRYQVMAVGRNGKAVVTDLQDLVAPYLGKEVRLTLVSFENLEQLALLAEQAGGGQVSGVMPEDLPGVSFDIQRSRS
jgi:hypothetical protein